MSEVIDRNVNQNVIQELQPRLPSGKEKKEENKKQKQWSETMKAVQVFSSLKERQKSKVN